MKDIKNFEKAYFDIILEENIADILKKRKIKIESVKILKDDNKELTKILEKLKNNIESIGSEKTLEIGLKKISGKLAATSKKILSILNPEEEKENQKTDIQVNNSNDEGQKTEDQETGESEISEKTEESE